MAHFPKEQKRSVNLEQVFLDGNPTVRLTQTSDRDAENVSAHSVLGLPAFLNAVRMKAGAVARTYVDCFKVNASGQAEVDKNHEAHWLLTWKANPFQSSHNWLFTLEANKLVFGNGYAVKDVRNGITDAVYCIDPREVSTIHEYQEGRLVNLYYIINTSEGPVVVPSEDMIHVKSLGITTGVEGVGILDVLRGNFVKNQSIQKFSELFFTQGGHFSYVVECAHNLNAKQLAEVREQLYGVHTGLKNSHRIPILMAGAKVNSFSLNADEAQLIGSAELTGIDIANITGVPAALLNVRNSHSYNSLAQDFRHFLVSLDSDYTQLETELELKLLRPKQQGNSHRISFNRDSLLSSDPEWQALQIQKYEKNVITLEELRESFGLSTTPKGKMKEQPAAPQGSVTEASPAEQDEPEETEEEPETDKAT